MHLTNKIRIVVVCMSRRTYKLKGLGLKNGAKLLILKKIKNFQKNCKNRLHFFLICCNITIDRAN